MDFKTVKERYIKPPHLSDFILDVKLGEEKIQLLGSFWGNGSSTYAKFDSNFATMKAGSHDSDPTRAKAKSLFRLINLIEAVLIDEEDYNISDENFRKYKDYLIKNKKGYDFSSDEKKIPVYEEELTTLGENKYRMRLLLDRTIENLSELYGSRIHEPKTFEEILNLSFDLQKGLTGRDKIEFKKELVSF
jgi:hypothetical protein